jgi:dephospho-CoA kinase
MFLVGLTGGIAAGKSTVAEHWERLGAIHIDADDLARRAVAAGTEAASAIRKRFGDGVFTPEGELDRKALGELVFADAVSRADLEAIVHPAVQAMARAELARVNEDKPADAIVVYNIPLLVETDSQLPFDAVVTVEAPQDKQIARMVKHRGMTEAEALKRIAAQATPIERAARADHILSSNQDLALLLRDAEVLFGEFENQARAKAEDESETGDIDG